MTSLSLEEAQVLIFSLTGGLYCQKGITVAHYFIHGRVHTVGITCQNPAWLVRLQRKDLTWPSSSPMLSNLAGAFLREALVYDFAESCFLGCLNSVHYRGLHSQCT